MTYTLTVLDANEGAGIQPQNDELEVDEVQEDEIEDNEEDNEDLFGSTGSEGSNSEQEEMNDSGPVAYNAEAMDMSLTFTQMQQIPPPEPDVVMNEPSTSRLTVSAHEIVTAVPTTVPSGRVPVPITSTPPSRKGKERATELHNPDTWKQPSFMRSREGTSRTEIPTTTNDQANTTLVRNIDLRREASVASSSSSRARSEGKRRSVLVSQSNVRCST